MNICEQVHDGTACFDPDPCKLHEDKPSNSDSETALKIPFILIDGSRTGCFSPRSETSLV